MPTAAGSISAGASECSRRGRPLQQSVRGPRSDGRSLAVIHGSRLVEPTRSPRRHAAARMATTLQPRVRPARSAQQAQMTELINARDRLVRDSHGAQERREKLTIASSAPVPAAAPTDRSAYRGSRYRDRQLIAADAALACRYQILTSIACMGTRIANQRIATMPEPIALRTSRPHPSRVSPLLRDSPASGKAKVPYAADTSMSGRPPTCLPSSLSDTIPTSEPSTGNSSPPDNPQRSPS